MEERMPCQSPPGPTTLGSREPDTISPSPCPPCPVWDGPVKNSFSVSVHESLLALQQDPKGILAKCRDNSLHGTWWESQRTMVWPMHIPPKPRGLPHEAWWDYPHFPWQSPSHVPKTHSVLNLSNATCSDFCSRKNEKTRKSTECEATDSLDISMWKGKAPFVYWWWQWVYLIFIWERRNEVRMGGDKPER